MTSRTSHAARYSLAACPSRVHPVMPSTRGPGHLVSRSDWPWTSITDYMTGPRFGQQLAYIRAR